MAIFRLLSIVGALVAVVALLLQTPGAAQPKPKTIDFTNNGGGWAKVAWASGRTAFFRPAAVVAVDSYPRDPVTKNPAVYIEYTGGRFRLDMTTPERALELADFIVTFTE